MQKSDMLISADLLHIVTAADATHSRSLLQFISSVKRHEPACRLTIYDLGFTRSFVRRLKASVGPNTIVKRFPFELYPDFFAMKYEAGSYAWKPSIIAEEAKSGYSCICWMDAGNVITGPLVRIRSDLASIGFYSTRSSGCIVDWTHPKMLEYFNLDACWCESLENLNGACVAFNLSKKEAASLLKDWAAFARIKECISPIGSSRINHRQDQALLSILAYKTKLVTRPSIEDNFKIHCDLEPHIGNRLFKIAYESVRGFARRIACSRS